MRHKTQGKIEWLEFDLLADIPELVHAVFLRHGGVSEGAFASLNLGGGTGDRPENIEANRESVQQLLGVQRLVSVLQEHGEHLEVILASSEIEVPACDGMITRHPHIGLMVQHADCQAAIFYDPVHRAIANVHAGWRGNVKNIYSATVTKMKKEFKTQPKDLLVCISPSLGPEWAEFKNHREEFPEHFWEFQALPNYFDLWAIARMQLQACGILPEHIEVAELCSYTHLDDFYSYRRDKVTGRNATVVALKT